VAESLRFDMLDPKVMPQLWAFSNDALRLEKHYSGGNLTQMGVFSMFYGLYGSNWFPMHAARRAPVLMDVCSGRTTSSRSTPASASPIPAFDKTVFIEHATRRTCMPSSRARRLRQRDAKNIDDILRLHRASATRRARSWPTCSSSPPTRPTISAGGGDRHALAGGLQLPHRRFATQTPQIKNRYINAAHHVDGQIGRVIDYLKRRDCSTRPSSSCSAITARSSWSAAAGAIAPSSTASRPARRR
jgi:membrane-anchored protein YejM (alkaline phosphatase superfamily)